MNKDEAFSYVNETLEEDLMLTALELGQITWEEFYAARRN